jgi:hypothetical protein
LLFDHYENEESSMSSFRKPGPETRANDPACRRRPSRPKAAVVCVAGALAAAALAAWTVHDPAWAQAIASVAKKRSAANFDQVIATNIQGMAARGRNTFRFDTFGDEAFSGDTLKLHLAIEGAPFGGVGGGISPKTALALGLKVDVDALGNAATCRLPRSFRTRSVSRDSASTRGRAVGGT